MRGMGGKIVTFEKAISDKWQATSDASTGSAYGEV